jgi:hypothetical protein
VESGSAAGDIVLTLDVAFVRGTERLTISLVPEERKRAA